MVGYIVKLKKILLGWFIKEAITNNVIVDISGADLIL